ncbi:MAG: hypothetical protein H8E15_13460 [Planctomycetes bacterium]|nr:hypothetical protein [Planctomycetota bacterium]
MISYSDAATINADIQEMDVRSIQLSQESMKLELGSFQRGVSVELEFLGIKKVRTGSLGLQNIVAGFERIAHDGIGIWVYCACTESKFRIKRGQFSE